MTAAPVVVVVNPVAGGGRTGRRWPRVREALAAHGVLFEERFTHGPGEATRLARDALERGAAIVVAVGGDGTLNEVVNGFFGEDGLPVRPDAALALLPSGTGGDFRRTIGLPADPLAAVATLASRSYRALDVGRIDYSDGSHRYFVNIADCGIGGEVVARVNQSGKKAGGRLTFLRHSLATLLAFTGRDLDVEVDGHVVGGRFTNVVVANGRYFGGSMLVAPTARCDDGLFEVVLFRPLPRLRAAVEMPRLYTGRHLGRPGVEHLRGRRVVLTSRSLDQPALFDVDGEQIGQAPATVTCLARALRFCAPADGGTVADDPVVYTRQ